MLSQTIGFFTYHPAPPYIVEEIVASIARLAEGVAPCRKVIVADGVKVRENSKFRSGIVTESDEANYRHYLARLHHLTLQPSSALHGKALQVDISLTPR